MTYQEIEKMNSAERVMLIGIGNRNTNAKRIMIAGILAEALTAEEIYNYVTRGWMPEVHTFDEWNRYGRAVKRGERRVFEAVIWIAKEGRTEATEADGDADELDALNFYQHKAYFFRKEQTEEITYREVEIPADVIREVRRGVEYLTGNTRPIKEMLKEANYKWSRKKSAWYRPVQAVR